MVLLIMLIGIALVFATTNGIVGNAFVVAVTARVVSNNIITIAGWWKDSTYFTFL